MFCPDVVAVSQICFFAFNRVFKEFGYTEKFIHTFQRFYVVLLLFWSPLVYYKVMTRIKPTQRVNTTVPIINFIVLFNFTSSILTWALFNHTGAQYIAVGCTRTDEAMRSVSASVSLSEPASFFIHFILKLTYIKFFLSVS